MKEILIFAGTTEGRKLSESLATAKIPHTICVATEYGEIVLKENPYTRVHRGRMDIEEMQKFLSENSFAAVVDATHPYADIVTLNIKKATKEMNVPYLRLKRDIGLMQKEEHEVRLFDTSEECAKALGRVEGNVLLTTGSKELKSFCVDPALRKRLYVRVLPAIESIELCMKSEIQGKQILALQGPFTTELNLALLKQYQIKCLVTKLSGKAGGFFEKLDAARKCGIPVYAIGHPGEDEGLDYESVCLKLEKILETKILQDEKLEIVLCGIGMGSLHGMTEEVRSFIEQADVLFGAKRMLNGINGIQKKVPYYLADQIIPYLEHFLVQGEKKIAVLFSGDSGFYSGCQKLYEAIRYEIQNHMLNAEVRILPGISSISYLSALIGESYQDAMIYSIHGKWEENLLWKIEHHSKMFMLLSGVEDLHTLGKMLLDAGLNHIEIIAGYQLSYEEQEILYLTLDECLTITKEGLYVCCIKNSATKNAQVTHGRTDDSFIRDKVPMTKEEVREISICKLQLTKGAVVYDIGSGTGSIAMEIASLQQGIQVYAIEQKKEALDLIEKNRKKFSLENVSVVSGNAPLVLETLPTPTHAFLGGTGGQMIKILETLYQKNPRMRIVINAISLETIVELEKVLESFPIEQKELVQVQVSRSKEVGKYHMMHAENPVWICSFQFCHIKE